MVSGSEAGREMGRKTGRKTCMSIRTMSKRGQDRMTSWQYADNRDMVVYLQCQLSEMSQFSILSLFVSGLRLETLSSYTTHKNHCHY
jgi:tRNA(Met) C34 N-acetyltransferase TmcA